MVGAAVGGCEVEPLHAMAVRSTERSEPRRGATAKPARPNDYQVHGCKRDIMAHRTDLAVLSKVGW